MTTASTPLLTTQLRASRNFLLIAAVSIIAAGFASAIGASQQTLFGLISVQSAHPHRMILWMTAFMVLVMGVAQALFGFGQAYIAQDLPKPRFSHPQCTIFNVSCVGVIASQITPNQWLTTPSTLLFAVAMILFLVGTRHARPTAWVWPYRLLVAFVGLSSLVGIFLSLALHS